MDAIEVAKRVEAVNRRARVAERVDWYERNVPIWLGKLKEMMNDGVWENEDLDFYCQKWFGQEEGEVADFLGLERTELEKIEKEVPERIKVLEGLSEKAREEIKVKKREQGKAMTQAERARAYRERRKAGK